MWPPRPAPHHYAPQHLEGRLKGLFEGQGKGGTGTHGAPWQRWQRGKQEGHGQWVHEAGKPGRWSHSWRGSGWDALPRTLPRTPSPGSLFCRTSVPSHFRVEHQAREGVREADPGGRWNDLHQARGSLFPETTHEGPGTPPGLVPCPPPPTPKEELAIQIKSKNRKSCMRLFIMIAFISRK